MSSPERHLTDAQRLALSGSTLLAFTSATADWRLTDREELSLAGYPAPDLYDEWCLSAVEETPFAIEEIHLIRINDIVGVHRAVRRVLPSRDDRIVWLTSSIRGPVGRGLSPFEHMADPDHRHVLAFRRRLDAWLGVPILREARYRRPARSAMPILGKSSEENQILRR